MGGGTGATRAGPRAILAQQGYKAGGEAGAARKRDGIEYDERMALLEEITWPKPLEELLAPAFAMYKRSNPWVADAELSPKSVVRDMVERAMTFAEFVSVYGLERTEGVVLRYLADAYRALRQVVPEEHRTEEVQEIVEWLGELVRGVDSSLLDEWERLAHPVDDDADTAVGDGPPPGAGPDAPPRPAPGHPRAFRRLLRPAPSTLAEPPAPRDPPALGTPDGVPGWAARACGPVTRLSSASPSASPACSPSPLIRMTKPLRRSGSSTSEEYMPISVPVCATFHWPSTSEMRQP